MVPEHPRPVTDDIMATRAEPLAIRLPVARAATGALTTGEALSHWGLILVLVAIGALKFTVAEAEGIKRLVETSPFMSWLYAVTDVMGASRLIGVVELVAALGMALHRVAPRAALAGSALAIVTFAATLSFLVTAPGAWDRTLGFPALGGTGQFVIKDVVLLGASVQAFARARRALSGAP